jgi:hypothetical protein
MSLLPLVSPAFLAYTCCCWRLLIFLFLSCTAIEPAVTDVLTAVDVSGGPAVVSTSAVAEVLTVRTGVSPIVVVPAVVDVPAVVVFQLVLVYLLLVTCAPVVLLKM